MFHICHLRPQSSANITAGEVLLYVPSASTWALAFFMNRGYGWSRECWKSFEKGKTKGLLCCNETCLSRDQTWAGLNLSHNRRPTIQQTLPSQTRHCAGARHSCGESHLGVRGNKCFFNWNSGISSCFLPVLYESPVPIVWKFALTSPWRLRLIEWMCAWTTFKRI